MKFFVEILDFYKKIRPEFGKIFVEINFEIFLLIEVTIPNVKNTSVARWCEIFNENIEVPMPNNHYRSQQHYL